MATENRELSREPKDAEVVSDRPRLVPAVDVYENERELLLLADLPGVTRGDLTIRLDKNELSLVGRRAAPAVLGEEVREFEYARSFVLPAGIDGAKIDAELKDGVLTVHLPKHESLQPRQISIKTG